MTYSDMIATQHGTIIKTRLPSIIHHLDGTWRTHRSSRYMKGSRLHSSPDRRLSLMSLKLIQFADNSRHLIQFPSSERVLRRKVFLARANIEPKCGESFTPEVNWTALCSLLPKRCSQIVESCRLPALGTSSSSRRAFGFGRPASCRRASDERSMSSHPLPTVCLMNVSCGYSSCRSSVESHDQVNSETLLRSSISNFSSRLFFSIFLNS